MDSELFQTNSYLIPPTSCKSSELPAVFYWLHFFILKSAGEYTPNFGKAFKRHSGGLLIKKWFVFGRTLSCRGKIDQTEHFLKRLYADCLALTEMKSSIIESSLWADAFSVLAKKSGKQQPVLIFMFSPLYNREKSFYVLLNWEA